MSSSAAAAAAADGGSSQVDQQGRRQDQVVAVGTTTTATLSVPRYIQVTRRRRRAGGRTEGHEMDNIIPRTLPLGDCIFQERAFRQEFEQRVTDLLKEFRRHFPYRQTIRWSIEYGDDKAYCLNVLVNPPRSTNNH